MNQSNRKPYGSVQMTDEEERKVRLALQQFRDKTKSMLRHAGDDSARPSADVEKDLTELKRQIDEELKAVLGDERFQSFRKNLSELIRPVLASGLITPST
jgi:hypothetical protein